MTSVSNNSAAGQSNNGAPAPASQNTITPDLNMFLQMLTTQLQNQDPLDPMDTSQYTQQLVQYSHVEQEMQQTDTLNNILAGLNSQGMSQASAYIGQQARFDSDTAGLLSTSPATWTYTLDQKPESLQAKITDSSGKVVNTITMTPADEGTFSWDGTTSDGSKAPDGAYTLSLVATNSSGSNISSVINSTGIVSDVVTDGSNIMLGVNGIRLSSSGLVSISHPAAAYN